MQIGYDKKHKDWAFTVFYGITDDDYNKAVDFISTWHYAQYMIVGKETCPETGRKHLQGYVQWTSGRTLTTLKKLNPKGVHWEPAKGTRAQNETYCTKEELAFVVGEPRPEGRQGFRSDLQSVKDMIDEGATIEDVAETHFETWVRSHKAFDKYHYMRQKARKDPPRVEWIWGAAGTGKTRYAWEQPGSKYIKDGTSWWDGYQNESCIIVDDFDGKWPYRDFLRFLDRYPYQGQVKGGYVKINSDYIIITCEHPPEYFWSDNELAQVTRRLSKIFLLKSGSEVPGNTKSGTYFENEKEKNFIEN